jgi:hypothetical protein
MRVLRPYPCPPTAGHTGPWTAAGFRVQGGSVHQLQGLAPVMNGLPCATRSQELLEMASASSLFKRTPPRLSLQYLQGK